jgi:hypothetical protein
MVALASDGQVDPAAAGGIILGLCMSYASGAGVKVLVADHPDQVFVGQLAAAQIDARAELFQTCDIVATAGNTTYLTSRQELDGSSESTNATAQLRILEIVRRPNNAFGANVEVRFRINEHAFTAAQANSPVGI